MQLQLNLYNSNCHGLRVEFELKKIQVAECVFHNVEVEEKSNLVQDKENASYWSSGYKRSTIITLRYIRKWTDQNKIFYTILQN